MAQSGRSGSCAICTGDKDVSRMKTLGLLNGRIGRGAYLLAVGACAFLTFGILKSSAAPDWLVFPLVALGIVVQSMRFRDSGRPGWIVLIPVVALLAGAGAGSGIALVSPDPMSIPDLAHPTYWPALLGLVLIVVGTAVAALSALGLLLLAAVARPIVRGGSTA
jgi:uncharacterized membrane protein YhaH (DUF805 family)